MPPTRRCRSSSGSTPRGISCTAPDHRVIRDRRYEARRHPAADPPRIHLEEATLDVVADAADLMGIVDTLTRVVRSRRTTAPRLREALDARGRFPRRAWVAGALDDVANGSCSVLEHGFTTHIERPHRLPAAQRQGAERTSAGRVYRDLAYPAWGLVVELDGALHDRARHRALDLDRDLEIAVSGRRSIRLGWQQVFVTPCRTAHTLARLLTLAGEPTHAHPCGPTCAPGPVCG